MSKEIDNRVVSMEFDNKNFLNSVANTIQSITNLKESLNFNKEKDAFKDVEKSADKVDFAQLAKNIESISSRFSTFGIVAVGALENIGQKAVDVGIKVAQALSGIEQMQAGWAKYESLTTSSATLLAQGYSSSVVEDTLARLNWFTDETSYNLTDMVQNISKFTAAGLGLSDSERAMEGIATWAALAGQNAGRASSAMYQLSQGLSAGNVRYEDWKSIQNYSMDTTQFREIAAEAAVANGVLKDLGNGLYSKDGNNYTLEQLFGSEGLTKGAWFTTDVLMDTLMKYSSAVTDIYSYVQENDVNTTSQAMEEMEALGITVDEFGLKAFKAAQEARTFTDAIGSIKDASSTAWMNIYKMVFGETETATQNFTLLANQLYDVFVEPINVIGDVVSKWAEGGGTEDIVRILNGIFDAFWRIKEPLDEIVHEYFPLLALGYDDAQGYADILKDISGRIADFIENLEWSEGTLERIDNILGGVKSAFNIILEAGKSIYENILTPIGSIISEIADDIFNLLSDLGVRIQSEEEKLVGTGFFDKFTKPIGDAITYVWEKIKVVISSIKEAINGDAFEWIRDKLSKVKEAAEANGPVIEKIFRSIAGAVKYVWETITKFDIKSPLESIFGAVDRVIDKVLDIVIKLAGGLKDVIGEFSAGNLFDILGSLVNMHFLMTLGELAAVFGSILDTLLKYQLSMDAEIWLKIAEAIALMAGSLILLSSIDSDKISSAVGTLTLLLGELIIAVKAMASIGPDGLIESLLWPFMYSVFDSIPKVSMALLELAGALWVISSIPAEQLRNAMLAITGCLTELVIVAEILGNSKFTNAIGFSNIATSLIPMGLALIEIAASMKIFADALAKFGALSWDEILKGVSSIGIILTELTLYSNLSKPLTIGEGLGFVLIGAALNEFAAAIGKLGDYSWEEILKGVVAIGAILTELQLYSTKSNVFSFFETVGLVLIGATLVEFGSAIGNIAKYSWEEILKGVVGIGAILTEVALYSRFSSAFGVLESIGLVLIGATLIEFGTAMDKLGKLSWMEISKGVSTIAVILGEISIFSLLPMPALLTSGSLLVIGGVLIEFAYAMSKLAELSWDDLLRAGVAVVELIGTCAGISLLAPIIDGAFLAAGKMALLIVEIGAILAALGGLAQIPGVEWVIDEGGKFLELIGASIGRFFGGIVGGFTAGATDFLPIVGNSLSKFVINAKSFFTEVRTIGKDDIVDNTVRLFDTIGKIKDVAKNIKDVNFDKFSKNLTSLASAMRSYASNAKDVRQDVVKKSAEAMGALFDSLKDVPRSGSDVVKWFAGEKQIDIFGSQLVKFSSSLRSYASNIKELGENDFTKMETVTNMLTSMLETMKDLPRNGSTVVKWFAGEQSLSTFGRQLAAFGTSMMTYSKNINELGEGDISKMEMVTGVLTNVISSMQDLPKNGSTVIKWLVGEQNLATFGSQLAQLGGSLRGYCANIRELGENDISKMEIANTATVGLIELAKALPKEDGIFDIFTGKSQSLGEWSEGLPKFGKAICDYVNSFEDFKTVNVLKTQRAADVANTLIDICNAIPGTTLFDWIVPDKIDNFVTDIPKFGSAINGFVLACSDLAEKDIAKGSGAAAVAAALATAVNNVPNTSLIEWFGGDASYENFATSLPDFATGIASFIGSLSDFKSTDVSLAGKCAIVVKDLSEVCNNIPKEGGLKDIIDGTISFENFKTGISGLGEGVVEFAKSTDGLKKYDIVNAEISVKMVDQIVELAKKLPKTGGAVQVWEGQQNLLTFASNLGTLGSHIKTYYENVAATDIEQLNTMTDALVKLIDAFTDANIEEGTFTAFIQNTRGIASQAVSEYCQIIEDYGVERVDIAVSAFFAAWTKSIAQHKDHVGNALKNVGTKAIDELDKLAGGNGDTEDSKTFFNIGRSFMSGIVDGMRSKMEAVTLYISNLASAVAASIQPETFATILYSSGQYVMDGLINGIENKTPEVNNITAKVAKGIKTKFDKTMEIHSPSKVMEKSGEFVALGVARGIINEEDTVNKSTEQLANEIWDTIMGTSEDRMDEFFNTEVPNWYNSAAPVFAAGSKAIEKMSWDTLEQMGTELMNIVPDGVGGLYDLSSAMDTVMDSLVYGVGSVNEDLDGLETFFVKHYNSTVKESVILAEKVKMIFEDHTDDLMEYLLDNLAIASRKSYEGGTELGTNLTTSIEDASGVDINGENFITLHFKADTSGATASLIEFMKYVESVDGTSFIQDALGNYLKEIDEFTFLDGYMYDLIMGENGKYYADANSYMDFLNETADNMKKNLDFDGTSLVSDGNGNYGYVVTDPEILKNYAYDVLTDSSGNYMVMDYEGYMNAARAAGYAVDTANGSGTYNNQNNNTNITVGTINVTATDPEDAAEQTSEYIEKQQRQAQKGLYGIWG